MKSNSDERPATFQRVAPNKYRYNYDITEVEREDEEGGKTVTKTSYDYSFVEFYGKPNYSTIVKLILREEKDETQEFELVNNYNAFMEEITSDEKAVAEYKEWMQRVIAVKAMVRSDIAAS